MNTVYLMKDEKRHYCLFKIGFTSNLNQRIFQYTTHNPECECLGFSFTQDKSKRNVEKMFHQEIKKRGYDFITAVLDGKETEWFKVFYNDPFYNELCEKGINAFKTGKKRKSYKAIIAK